MSLTSFAVDLAAVIEKRRTLIDETAGIGPDGLRVAQEQRRGGAGGRASARGGDLGGSCAREAWGALSWEPPTGEAALG